MRKYNNPQATSFIKGHCWTLCDILVYHAEGQLLSPVRASSHSPLGLDHINWQSVAFLLAYL